MRKPKPVFRILIVEDDADRTKILKSWLPEDVRTVVVTSAGKAMGLLARDRGNVYGGILLDHDLQMQTATEKDRFLCGNDVVNAVIANISRDVPIFVHSANVQQAPVMATRLENADFWVTRIPIYDLKKEQLLQWVEDVQELWEDRNEL
jgi:CheY-like chemotaxis protein